MKKQLIENIKRIKNTIANTSTWQSGYIDELNRVLKSYESKLNNL